MATLADALVAYRICAQAEGKSPKTIRWIMSSVAYFREFLGPNSQDIDGITGNDLRRFIIELQQRPKFLKHPYLKPRQDKLTTQSIETYARAIRAFFGYLHREEMIDHNPTAKVKMPKVIKKVVPTFSDREVEILLAQPNKKTDRGFRDYALMLTLIDTAARLSEVANPSVDDVDIENGYLKILGKGGKERYIPFGYKVAKALLKYKMKHRPTSVGTDHFWLTVTGAPLGAERIEKIVWATSEMGHFLNRTLLDNQVAFTSSLRPWL